MEAMIRVDLVDSSLIYEALRMYRDEFSKHLQGLRQTEYQFQAATIALAKIEGMLGKWEKVVQTLTPKENDDDETK